MSGALMVFRSAYLTACFLVLAALAPVVAQQRQPARVAQPQSNSIGMQLVRIPAGEFLMGGSEPADELVKAFPNSGRKPEDFADAYPRHRVLITKPYSIGRYEVTIGQFRQFADATGYKTTA